jgi:glucose/arabinose dehydrogenase
MRTMRTARSYAAVAVAGILLATATGCDGDGEKPGPRSSAPPAPATSAAAPVSPTAGGAATGVPDLNAPKEMSRDIEAPWGLTFLPGGGALVAERDSGRILRVPQAGGRAEEVYRVPGVDAAGEGGLLGLAVSPNYATDQYVYAYITASSDNRIVRLRLSGGGQPQVIFSGIDKSGIHNGGRLAFGPDGMLYAGTGDAGNRGESQDPDDPNGKILRLTPDGGPAPGNPRSGSPVYSLGHRNVQGLAWDAQGRLFASEFGQNEFDEVNLIRPGRNYGWPEVEGRGDTHGGRFTNPLVTWHTDEASPSGAAIAGGNLYVAALRGQRLWVVPLRGDQLGEPHAELRGRYGRLRTVAAAPDGSLWLTTSNRDGRGDPRDGDDRIVRFPAG